MEVIYLWIEEYKNIKNQGFNLSPKYNCNYNSEKKELTIKENQNHINIFPENINVTAIVGKNGSGKSNLIKAIFELIYLYFFRKEQLFWWEDDKTKEDDIINIKTSLFVDNFINHKFFLIIKDRNEFFKIDSEYIKKLLQKEQFESINKYCHLFYEYKLKNISNYEDKITSFSIYYNFSTDSWFDEQSFWVNEIYHRKDEYKIPLLIEPYKKDNKIDLKLIKTLTNQRILLFYSLLNNKLNESKITSFFNPDRIKVGYSTSNTIYEDELKKKNPKKSNNTLANYSFLPYKVLIKYINFKKLDLKTIFTPVNNIKIAIEKLYENNDYENLNLLYLLFKLCLLYTSPSPRD
jgi:hypothetical protein